MRSVCRMMSMIIAMLLISDSVRAAGDWHLVLLGEAGVPSGWVQVRENAVEGTRLHFADGLGVKHTRALALHAWKPLSDVSEVHLAVAGNTLQGNTMINDPVFFNGTTLAPGRLAAITRLTDFLVLNADYWRRMAGFGNGGRLWGSVGVSVVLLNFRLQGTIAADSIGHELKEDFNTQELPVPTLGLHLRDPLSARWNLTADVSAGYLPWVNSLRKEGGEVRLQQTEAEGKLGLEYNFASHWQAVGYVYGRHFIQQERSHEDGNVIHLNTRGVGLGIAYRF